MLLYYRLFALCNMMLFGFFGISQPCSNPPSEQCDTAPILCSIDEIDGYCFTMSQNITGLGPSPLCNGGGAPHNVSWFAFYAGCTDINLTLTPSNCKPVNGGYGIQAAIFSYGEDGLCPNSTYQPDQTIWCQSIPCFDEPVLINANGLECGQIYYFMIDGCAGSVCDISISLNSPCGEPMIGDWTSGIKYTLNSDPCDLDFNNNSACFYVEEVLCAKYYNWYINGTLVQEGIYPSICNAFYDPCFVPGTIGTFELCVKASNDCVSGDKELCKIITYVCCPKDVSIESESDTINCAYPEIKLLAKSNFPGVTFTWEGHPGQTDTFHVSKAGEYNVYASYSGFFKGCSRYFEYSIYGDTMTPMLTPLPGILNCLDSLTNIGVKIAQADSVIIAWTDPFGDSIMAQTANLDVAQAGLYTVLVTNALNGCHDSIKVEVLLDTISPTISMDSLLVINCVDLSVSPQLVTDENLIFNWTGEGLDSSMLNEKHVVFTEAGNYYLTVTNPTNNCTTTDSVKVLSEQIYPEITFSGDTMLNCMNPNHKITLTVNGSGAYSIVWFKDGEMIADSVYSVTISSDGVYTVEVTDIDNKCATIKEICISEDYTIPEIEMNISAEILTCLDTVIAMDGLFTRDILAWEWRGPNGSISKDTSIYVTNPGLYILNVMGENGCLNSKQIIISESKEVPQPLITASNMIDCFHDSTVLSFDLQSWQDSITYFWEGPDGSVITDQEITTYNSGKYILTLKYLHNECHNADTFNILKLIDESFDYVVFVNHPDCQGEESGSIEIICDAQVSAGFLYRINGLSFQISPLFKDLEPGSYHIEMQGVLGCQFSLDTIDLIRPENHLSVSLGPDILMYPGQDTVLTANVFHNYGLNLTYLWEVEGLKNGTAQEILPIKPSQTTQYSITVTDEWGCTALDNILVHVSTKHSVYLPNVFHPGDGLNSRFYVQSDNEVVLVEKMEVFDRWGERVFAVDNVEPNIPEFGWNGSHKGRVAEQDVYVYQVKVLFKDGHSFQFVGDVLLLK